MELRRRGVVYYESIKRELKIKPIYECRCDERLQTILKIMTSLTNEKFASVKGECEIQMR